MCLSHIQPYTALYRSFEIFVCPTYGHIYIGVLKYLSAPRTAIYDPIAWTDPYSSTAPTITGRRPVWVARKQCQSHTSTGDIPEYGNIIVYAEILYGYSAYFGLRRL